jgi:hypothetical protein
MKKNFPYTILILLLILIISFGISFSRYTSIISNTGDYSSSITVKEYNLDAIWDLPPTDLQSPGISNQRYGFTLENTKANDLHYTITIAMSWDEATPVIGLNVPLAMKLYKVNGDDSLTPMITKVTRTRSAGEQINNLYTQEEVIAGNQSINFCLQWSWGTTAEDRNYRFANKDINIKIDVNAYQAQQ